MMTRLLQGFLLLLERKAQREREQEKERLRRAVVTDGARVTLKNEWSVERKENGRHFVALYFFASFGLWLLAKGFLAETEKLHWYFLQFGGAWLAFWGIPLPGLHWAGTQRDRFLVDRTANEWETERGIFPFYGRKRGPLSEIQDLHAAQENRLQRNEDAADTTYEVWTMSVRWRDTIRAPLALKAFERRVNILDAAETQEIYRNYAEAVRLPLTREEITQQKGEI